MIGAALSSLRLKEAKRELQEGVGQLNAPSHVPQTLNGQPSGSLMAESINHVFTMAMSCTLNRWAK